MKNHITILALILFVSCNNQSTSHNNNVVENKYATSLRAMNKAERALFEMGKKNINMSAESDARSMRGPQVSPITEECEATWMAENHAVLNSDKFAASMDINKIMMCAEMPAEGAFMVGKTEDGKYVRMDVIKRMGDWVTTTMPYDDRFAWLEVVMKKHKVATYSVLSIYGRDYYVVESGGKAYVYKPDGDSHEGESILSFINEVRGELKNDSKKRIVF